MEEEILQLKEELEKQRNRCARLEDEMDDLAVDNDRLRKLLASGGSSDPSGFTSRNVTSHSNNSGGGLLPAAVEGESFSSDINFDWRELLIDGDANCADAVQYKIENACGGMNALCVAFCAYPGAIIRRTSELRIFVRGIIGHIYGVQQVEISREGSESYNTVHPHRAIVCGGVDKILRIYGFKLLHEDQSTEVLRSECSLQSDFKPVLLGSYTLTAPILSIDTFGSYIACSLMDGGHAVIDTLNGIEVPNVTIFHDHCKYVVSIKWSPNGSHLATVSHDKTVNLYKKSVTSDGLIAFIKVHTARFIVTPECAVFAKNSKKITEIKSVSVTMNDKDEQCDNRVNGVEVEKEVEEVENESDCEWELIIALRDTPHLTYLHCGTYEQRFVTLNETVWDTHCSFTPLHLAVSPNQKYLLIATDKNFHFIVKIGESKRLRLLAGGHSSGDFGKPRVSWDCTGKYIYCNNEDGVSITVYSISTEKPVRSLSVHTGSVRDVVCHPTESLVASASYDKSVILFCTKNV